ncbi:hypothetical protein [Halorussus halobius]|uniref:hypothetical protein n=1 Tax=Halorussus halobius TaxID=1710537 RepID=UPI001091CB8C|nr:hypothetical protein [Halorussus halobius]
MVEQDLGEATIAYEGPDGETVEENVENEHVAYFQDHWMLRTGEDEQGRDRVRRIPSERVFYVERTVEEFEREVETVRDQVQSVAEDLRSKLLGGERGPDADDEDDPEVYRIDVESGESVGDADHEGQS